MIENLTTPNLSSNFDNPYGSIAKFIHVLYLELICTQATIFWRWSGQWL